jgi:hypothetical protein
MYRSIFIAMWQFLNNFYQEDLLAGGGGEFSHLGPRN